MTLHVRGVSKTSSNGVQALKGVILTIPAGMGGLLGPNGSGKSTLMRNRHFAGTGCALGKSWLGVRDGIRNW
jgi:ABC-type phosphate/phosphonate transport system ATPase subunit